MVGPARGTLGSKLPSAICSYADSAWLRSVCCSEDTERFREAVGRRSCALERGGPISSAPREGGA